MHFTSALHLGYGVGDQYDRSANILYSDTLSAALCSVWAKCGEDVTTFLASFRVSSAMPSYDGRLFMPMPPDKQCIIAKNSDGNYKRLKRLLWIELPLWESLAQNGRLEITEEMISDCGTAIVEGSGAGIVIMRRIVDQKVQVGLPEEDARPYFFDKLFLGPKVSLYVMYETTDEEKFQRAFRLLADAGVGTSRSTGNGGFDVDFQQTDVNIDHNVSSSQLLSMWIPQQAECGADVMSRSSYKIQLRGGYMAGAEQPSHRHLIKKSVYMIESGSVIAIENPVGTTVDLRPDGVDCHPVWRDGRTLSLPFKS